jgi:cysteine sulfinate desulfinase/cysteine desulfurase-like protein
MGLAPDLARSAIRISLSFETTRDDIARFIEVWRTITASHSAEQKVA